jgi:hypothetical protein
VGTYTELTIADYPVISSKSAVIPEVMTLFRESDHRVFGRKVTERNALVWGEPDDPKSEEVEAVVEYSCETAKVLDRLNVMGFTLRRVREEFEASRLAQINKYGSCAEDEDDARFFADDRSFFQNLTFDLYVEAFGRIMRDGLRPVPFDDHMKDGLDAVTKYILGDNDDYPFGFLGSDVRCLIRLACEMAPENSRVVQDITALVDGGYCDEDELVCRNATRALTAGHPENSSRVLLTEGSTDATILQEALATLYPHLSEYYAFLDFDSSRSPGGAGHLVSLVKAFSAAGITNRIIALFDNDTAAQEARRALANISLPANIIVMAYPDIELLRAYPTLGPGGLTSLDVNGLAASIELYLGEDVLRDEENAFTPVQWKGYNEVLKQYQGEVLGKARLLDRFQKKAERCRADPKVLTTTDWSGLSAILQKIFHAFD